MKEKSENWKPLAEDKLREIRKIFNIIFPYSEYSGLAEMISDYWIKKLEEVWSDKSDLIKNKDRQFRPSDPLSRIKQKTVVICYADSVSSSEEKSLITLDKFLGKYFPAVRGMHMLPACEVVESRFNDGFFSQVVRDKIHRSFGTNKIFSEMMGKYYSMADFVLNHVDINNPMFQAYLNGDDSKGECFYIYTEEEYKEHLDKGDFDQVVRPRPFPLFSIFRRKPKHGKYQKLSHAEKVEYMKTCFKNRELSVVGGLPAYQKLQGLSQKTHLN